MSITVKPYGSADGKDVKLFTLTNSNGLKAEITNYGGIIVRLFTPDKNGKLDDIVLGFDSLEDYLKGNPFFGALIGRHANRIENSEFTINGIVYKLAANEGNNHIHGGTKGFDKVVWDAEAVSNDNGDFLKLRYTSMDGEENYPGNLDVVVTYSLTDDNELVIDYEAVSDKDTVVNLTNHSYFNLSGHDSGSIYKHQLMINADKFTVVDENLIPTGEIRDVAGTPMDFTGLKSVESGIDSDYEQIVYGNGYDHNFVLNNKNGVKDLAAKVFDPKSGRVMEVYTTKPGVQFYSGNFLDGSVVGKKGTLYEKRSGFCLETQYFPNAMKHGHFPSPVLKAGGKYCHTTVYKFPMVK